MLAAFPFCRPCPAGRFVGKAKPGVTSFHPTLKTVSQFRIQRWKVNLMRVNHAA